MTTSLHFYQIKMFSLINSMDLQSCLTNLLETFEDWTLAIDLGQSIDAVFLDFKKAFPITGC